MINFLLQEDETGWVNSREKTWKAKIPGLGKEKDEEKENEASSATLIAAPASRENCSRKMLAPCH
jgi:hypothetical protein